MSQRHPVGRGSEAAAFIRFFQKCLLGVSYGTGTLLTLGATVVNTADKKSPGHPLRGPYVHGVAGQMKK